jgi:hypothetical protein
VELQLVAVARVTAERDAAIARETYWRTRAERLTDAALVRAGAIHQPTMEDPGPLASAPNPLRGMQMKEIPRVETTPH